MTNSYHSFIVNKMKVYRGNECALEIELMSGLNVIHGSNSAGKSSLLDTLAYSLGAENIVFSEIVNSCSQVMTEVSIANNKLTIQRQISESSRAPLAIYYGDMDAATTASDREWHIFPYNSSNEKFGFSKIFFDYLNYPATVSSETSITTHQILRILYADQPNNHLPIFRNEKWDNIEKRGAIRDYIFGIFSGELYHAQVQKKITEKQLSESIHKLTSIFSLLGKTSDQMIEEYILAEKKAYEDRKDSILNNINEIKSNKIESQLSQDDVQKELQIQLTNTNKSVLSIENQLNSQELEVLDLTRFKEELNQRMLDLNNSIDSNKLVHDIFFDYCPSCHSKINHVHHLDKNICSLCKEETSQNINESNLLQLKTELNFQIQETDSILTEEISSLNNLKKIYAQKIKEREAQKQEFEIITNKWHSSYELEFINNYRELGEVEAELKNIEKRLEISNEIKKLESTRNALQDKFNMINADIDRMVNSAERKRTHVINKLNLYLKQLLSKDIGIQSEFLDPHNEVEVIFEDNQIKVNGISHFSQSSSIVLRQMFHLALLQLSDNDPSLRIPRFLILDGINDGGLEKERAANLQNIIYETCDSLKSDFQVICATSELFTSSEKAHKIEYLNGQRTFS